MTVPCAWRNSAMETTLARSNWTAGRAWAVSIAQAAAGAYFVVAGLLKLTSADTMVAAFARWGWPGSARVAFGVVELLGGVTLVVPRFARAAALMLATLMVGSM